jgi:hypothetical protein
LYKKYRFEVEEAKKSSDRKNEEFVKLDTEVYEQRKKVIELTNELDRLGGIAPERSAGVDLELEAIKNRQANRKQTIRSKKGERQRQLTRKQTMAQDAAEYLLKK